jgi:hypothetical protein
MTVTYHDELTEHECPRALEQPAEEFAVGGMFLSPAGRWETITDRSPYAEYSARVTIRTDRTGDGYAWTFWRSTKFPYLPSWLTDQPTEIKAFEIGPMIQVELTATRGWGHGYELLSAHQVRGAGWSITDRPDGVTVEQVTVANKARTRAEVNRRARAHARRLGVPLRREPVPA